MRKVIDFIKKPLLIISCIIFAVFAVILIAVSSQSHGEKYEYSERFLGVGMDITLTFKSETTLELEMIVAGEKVVEQTNLYKIQDGDLYTYNTEAGTWGKDGEIDAYEFELEFPVDEELGVMSGMEFELVCKQNQNLKTLSVVIMTVFGVLSVGSAAVLVLDKKGMLKFLFKNQEATANAEVQSADAAQTAPVQPIAPETPVVETAPVQPEAQSAEPKSPVAKDVPVEPVQSERTEDETEK